MLESQLTLFQQSFSFIMAPSFIDGKKLEFQEKSSYLSQVTDTVYHIMLY